MFKFFRRFLGLLPYFFDLVIGLLKWPVAVMAVVMLPDLIRAFHYFSLDNMCFFVFLAGAFIYLALKIVASARSNVSMQILAHEFTHIFFAILTFHRVVHIHLNFDESGGAMGFKGKGNWLIVIAPYFFPLFIFFLMLGITFFSDKLPDGYWVNGFLGYFFAYHIESIAIQIHGEQPDFKEVGFPFCILFLPAANILVCSIILAFNNGGWDNVLKYLRGLWFLFEKNSAFLMEFFTS